MTITREAGMGNLELEKVRDVSDFRKIAIGTWRTTYDPQVYGTLEILVDRSMEYMERFRAATGLKVTITHLVAKAIARAFERIPDANAILRFHRPWRRKRIGVFFQIAMTDEGDDKIDLSGATLYDVEQKSLVALIREFQRKVDKVRKRQDEALEKTRRSFRIIPFWLVHQVLSLISFLTYTLNLKLPGVTRDPFGSVMVTNIGSLGLDMAYAPLVPYSRVPMVLALGEVQAVPVAEDGQVVIRQRIKINATFDHRFIDGYHAAVMSKVIRETLANPEKHLGTVEEAAAELQAAIAAEQGTPSAPPA